MMHRITLIWPSCTAARETERRRSLSSKNPFRWPRIMRTRLNNLAGLQLAQRRLFGCAGQRSSGCSKSILVRFKRIAIWACCYVGGGDSHSGEIALRNAITLARRIAEGPLPPGKSANHRRQT